jgi:hypothetical protein
MNSYQDIVWTGAIDVALVLGAALVFGPGLAAADPDKSESNKRPFTKDFFLDECDFVHDDTGLDANRWWFPLIPGNQAEYDDGEGGTNVITICDIGDCDGFPAGTAVIDGVTTRVIEERETEDGELLEVSHNFFARCEQTNSVIYFGEDVDIFTDEGIVHDGEWRAGVDGAKAGIIMPGQFILGARYLQEIAPGIALDRAENANMNVSIEVPYDGGTVFEGCVRVFETSDLHASDRSEKVYCAGVGLVFDSGQELVDKNY